ncbi:MAG: hypothetical protein PHC88_16300 [Terrimicrobiaceae bacterium]|nr:hypothetical protein [Terrimicrobiaceae bacterium]
MSSIRGIRAIRGSIPRFTPDPSIRWIWHPKAAEFRPFPAGCAHVTILLQKRSWWPPRQLKFSAPLACIPRESIASGQAAKKHNQPIAKTNEENSRIHRSRNDSRVRSKRSDCHLRLPGKPAEHGRKQ